jgi:sialidase-1
MTRREAIALLTSGAAQASPVPSTADLFVSGAGGYDTYRIPSLLRTARVTLLAFCEGRRNGRGDSGDIDIVLRRSVDQGRTWSAPVTIHDMRDDTIGNPCPVADRTTGAIHLLLTSNPGNVTEKQIVEQTAAESRRVWVSVSADDGIAWSKPAEITSSVKDPSWTWYATGPGIGIQLRSGRLVIPCDHKEAGTQRAYAHCIYSDDHGRTWQRGQRTAEKTNECQVVELRDGTLLLNMRSYHGLACRAVARSRDGGVSWSALEHDHALIEPVCQASLIRSSGGLLLFSNPASKKRENLTVKASLDEGRSWPLALVLAPGPSAYSCLAGIGRNRYACLYECGVQSPYERIAFARFDRKQLRAIAT